MSYKPILIVAGDPNSIFYEIFFKSLKKIKVKSPLILIASSNLISLQMKKLNFDKKLKIINEEDVNNLKLNNKCLNIIDIKYEFNKISENNQNKKNKYIVNCFNKAFNLIKNKKIKRLINGPIDKKTFLNKKYLGVTEYISSHFKIKKYAMLIFNEKLSVCPITTHMPLKRVVKKIDKKIIIEKIKIIEEFYITFLKKKPKIGILGINPHCESIAKFNEDEIITKTSVHFLKKKKISN